MIGSLPIRNTLVCRLSSKFIPLEAPCQDIPDLPVQTGQVAHFWMIGVAQNAISKHNLWGNNQLLGANTISDALLTFI